MQSSGMKQQVCYRLRYIRVGNPFLHKYDIPVMLGQNEQSQIQSDREVFGIFLGGEKSKTEVVLRQGFVSCRQTRSKIPVFRGKERASHNTLVSAQKGVNSATQ